jgi:ribose-phosphate pyrophosphokinase
VPTSAPPETKSLGFKLVAGTGNRPLVEEVARCLGRRAVQAHVHALRRRRDLRARRREHPRMDLFIVQPTNPPADNLMELLLLVDAARRASAARITVVMPYYGYSRQDRKDQPRVAIGAKLVANMIEAAGADRVLGVDFHQHQLQGFFDIPVDHLYARPVLVNHYRASARRPRGGRARRGRGEDGARLRPPARRRVRHPRQAAARARTSPRCST